MRADRRDSTNCAMQKNETLLSLDDAGSDYRVLVEAMNEGAAILTTSGVFLYSNRRLEAMLNLKRGTLFGQTIFRLVAPVYRNHLGDIARAGTNRAVHW